MATLFVIVLISQNKTVSASQSASPEQTPQSNSVVLEWQSLSVEAELLADKAPVATSEFLKLVDQGFYNGGICHRQTTAGFFVLQCGISASGQASGGTSWGPIENSPTDTLYPAGTLAMARVSNNQNSMSSQFFVVYQDSYIPNDDVGGYTIFGRITSGLADLVESLSGGTTDSSSDGTPKFSESIRVSRSH